MDRLPLPAAGRPYQGEIKKGCNIHTSLYPLMSGVDRNLFLLKKGAFNRTPIQKNI
jgi:hypothetical protein